MVGILEVASVSPFEDPDSQRVITLLDQVGYIKLTRQAAVLRIAGLLAVDPHLMSGIYTSEMKNDSSALPFLRNRECTDI